MAQDHDSCIILPANHHISPLIMKYVDEKVFHPGCERTLTETRQKYWLVRGRGLARKLVKDCAICRKLCQPPHTTLMADLPPERTKPFSPPFCDLFGLFNLKYSRHKSTKAWGALFTCATMRAIQLEVVESLSTESFLQALQSLVSPHGWPDTFISDNGKSFVGAEKELRKLIKEGRENSRFRCAAHDAVDIYHSSQSPSRRNLRKLY